MNEKEDLELLLGRLELFKEAQLEYAVRKNTANEKKKIEAERRLDTVVKMLKKKGYIPNRDIRDAKTNNLF
jgi:hypothetical protein